MNKIPEFPDQEEVKKFTDQFLPYSDFNFANLWSWDIHQKMMIGQLYKNLVVLFNDYITGEHFLTFIGKNKITETASELIAFSKRNYHTSFLKLIPEEIAAVLSEAGFNVAHDRDAYDYIYSVEHLATMNNWSKNTSGKRIRNVLKSDAKYVVKQSSIEEILKEEHLELFKKWANNKNINTHFELNEYKAFERLLQIKDKNIEVISLYVNNLLVGFTVYEIISEDYAISHFAKVDKRYHHSISDLLNWEEAKCLDKKGIKYFNWELDLGITGLRYAKEKYHPAFFFKKFIISK